MKRLMIVCAVVGLVLTTGAVAQVEIDKEVSADEASLGDHITVTITVENSFDEVIKVEDVLPDALGYIVGTFEVNGEPVEPTIEDNTISTMVEPGSSTITFEVQVVEVQYEDVTIENVASVYSPDEADVASDSEEILLHPYLGFSKEILNCTEPDPEYVPIYTDVHWVLRINVLNIPGDSIALMEDIVVTDDFGGDIEIDRPDTAVFRPPPGPPGGSNPSSGVIRIRTTGKTEKIHLTWLRLDDLSNRKRARFVLEVSTDVNPGQAKKDPPKNEYTSEGEHELNSGATLKFIDPATGLQLSAHTAPIMVVAYVPEE